MVTEQEQKPTQQQHLEQAEQATQERGRLEGLIRERVLRDLGEPPDLLRVNVLQLWGDHYRVNVFVGPDVTSARVAHSYFLTADSRGKIHKSTPAITRQY